MRLYQIAYAAGPRRRKIINGKFEQLFQGHSPDMSYPGDKFFREPDMLCVQLHHLKINDVNIHLANKELYNLTIFYPEIEDFVSLEEPDEDED